MIFLLLSGVCFFLFRDEIKKFPYHINRQIYDEYWQLCPDYAGKRVDFSDFLQNSRLIANNKNCDYLLIILLLINFLFALFHQSYLVFIVLAILILLAIIDGLYYLTDSKYLALLFFIALIPLSMAEVADIQLRLYSLLLMAVIFLAVIPVWNKWRKKEYLGLGDSLLLVALSPLFELAQLALWLFLASVFALIFALGCWAAEYWRRSEAAPNVRRLPFIPFITFSTFCCFIAKMPA